jgi:hypothetical protein
MINDESQSKGTAPRPFRFREQRMTRPAPRRRGHNFGSSALFTRARSHSQPCCHHVVRPPLHTPSFSYHNNKGPVNNPDISSLSYKSLVCPRSRHVNTFSCRFTDATASDHGHTSSRGPTPSIHHKHYHAPRETQARVPYCFAYAPMGSFPYPRATTRNCPRSRAVSLPCCAQHVAHPWRQDYLPPYRAQREAANTVCRKMDPQNERKPHGADPRGTACERDYRRRTGNQLGLDREREGTYICHG